MRWRPLDALPDLRRVGTIAIDTETKDGGLLSEHGSAWPWGDGYIAGISVAYRAEGSIQAHYFPLRHPDSANFDREQIIRWLRDHLAADLHIVGHNTLYDFGWLRTDFGLAMPPPNGCRKRLRPRRWLTRTGTSTASTRYALGASFPARIKACCCRDVMRSD